jgi:hypothetical protein
MDHGARIFGNEVRILDYGVWVFDRGPRPKGQNAQKLSKKHSLYSILPPLIDVMP